MNSPNKTRASLKYSAHKPPRSFRVQEDAPIDLTSYVGGALLGVLFAVVALLLGAPAWGAWLSLLVGYTHVAGTPR